MQMERLSGSRHGIVAGGNHQQFGQDYFETYAPVVDFAIVRVLLYVAVCSNMCMAQIDVKTAFLNVELDEDVWVRSPVCQRTLHHGTSCARRCTV
jgi:alpha-acetolactate decarboxylase